MLKLYADDTWLASEGFAGGMSRGRALCSDGKVRAVRFPRGGHADTFFSVPATVTVEGKTVSGFITVSSRAGFDTPTELDPAVVKFTAVKYGRNGGLLP